MKKIMLASSSDVFLTRNSNLLKQRGIKLFTAKSGAEALGLHTENQVDLVLADYELDDMDSCTLCENFRTYGNGDLPFILVSHNHPESIRRGEEKGASAMLLKPVDPTLLLRTVGSLAGLELIRSKRVELRVDVSCANNELDFSCISRDVSTSGILVEAGHDLDSGSLVVCRFTLPDSSRITADSEVIRCETSPDGKRLYGFKFLDLTETCRKAIDNYVSSATLNLPHEIPSARQSIQI